MPDSWCCALYENHRSRTEQGAEPSLSPVEEVISMNRVKSRTVPSGLPAGKRIRIQKRKYGIPCIYPVAHATVGSHI